MEITLKSVEADHFGYTWEIKVFNLLSKIGFWIFYDDAYSGIVLGTVERFRNAYLQRTRGLFFWYFLKSPTKMNRAVFVNK
jgi:hypothetical protein